MVTSLHRRGWHGQWKIHTDSTTAAGHADQGRTARRIDRARVPPGDPFLDGHDW